MIVRARDRVTGEVRWARIKATAVRAPSGAVRLAINLVDMAEEYEAKARELDAKPSP